MTLREFDEQFARLEAHFHLPADDSRDTIAGDWFKAVEHYHVDALDRAVTDLIRTATDRYWPALGKLLAEIQSKIDRYARTPGSCATCQGSTWIEAWPWWSHGRVYTGFQRCPDCGVPAPSIVVPETRRALTAAEYAAFKAGTLEQVPEPVSRSRRHRTAGHGMSTFTAPI